MKIEDERTFEEKYLSLVKNEWVYFINKQAYGVVIKKKSGSADGIKDPY